MDEQQNNNHVRTFLVPPCEKPDGAYFEVHSFDPQHAISSYRRQYGRYPVVMYYEDLSQTFYIPLEG